MSAGQEQQQEPSGKGLECPKCGCPESRVYYTRRKAFVVNGTNYGGNFRRRICTECGYEFSTVEKVQGGR